MIIWSGFGPLTILFAIVGFIAGSAVGSFAGALVGGVVGGGVAAYLNYIVAKKLGGERILIDPATQQQVVVKKSNSIFFIPMMWFTPVLAVGGILIGVLGLMAGQHDKNMNNKYPGKVVFDQADKLINRSNQGVTFHGNTPAAGKAAQKFSELFKSMQSASFTGGEKYSSDPFLTYCHEGKSGVTFLCHVPGLSKYKDDEVKKILSGIAWVAGCSVTKDMPSMGPENVMTVGLRGITTYGSILQGKPSDEHPTIGTNQEILYKIFDPANDLSK